MVLISELWWLWFRMAIGIFSQWVVGFHMNTFNFKKMIRCIAIISIISLTLVVMNTHEMEFWASNAINITYS